MPKMAELQKLLQTQEVFNSGLVENLLAQTGGSPSSISAPMPVTGSPTIGNLNLPNINNSPRSLSPGGQHRGSPNINQTRDDNAVTRTSTTTSTGGDINLNLPSGATTEVESERNINTRSTPGSHGGFTQGIDMKYLNYDSAQHFHVDPNANCLSDVAEVLNKAKESPSDGQRLLLALVTDHTTKAHMSTTLNTLANIREANERIAKQQDVPPQHMPNMSQLSLRPSMMWQHFMDSMVPEVTKVVQFAKKLPGVNEVDIEDQCQLIRQGSFEVMVSRITLLIDNVNDTMLDPALKMKSPRSVVRQMSPFGSLIDEFFEVAKLTNPLRLSDGENGLFSAILLLCPDRSGLKNAQAVRKLQQLYIQALYTLMNNNHKDADQLFHTLISAIPTIRKVNDEHFRYLNMMKQKSVSDFDTYFPQLAREMFDTTYQTVAQH